MATTPPVPQQATPPGPLAPAAPVAPTMPTAIPTVPVSLPQPVTSALQQMRNVAHAAATVVALLVLIYQAVLLSLSTSGFNVHPSPVAAGIAGAIIAISQTIDSWWNVNQTTNAVNAGGKL